jgi:response regulator RpfG family c-di-GMP phosphodiesterase
MSESEFTLTDEVSSISAPHTRPSVKQKLTEAVLFVDDEKHILSSIRRLIRPLKLTTFFAESGADGLKILEENHIDLVVSDMRMPEMDGAQFLTKVKQNWPSTVRVLLTGYADISSTIEALNNGGIYRYISKPWDDDELKTIVLDALKLKRLERERKELGLLTKTQNIELQDLNKNLEAKVEARTLETRTAHKKLNATFQSLRDSYNSFVQVFSSVINKRDSLKRAESQVVADLAKEIAKALKLKDETVQAVYYAALLHQLGKISYPDKLLNKPEDEMSQEEKLQYQEYPLIGEAALTAIQGLERSARFIRQHTELYDGSGYPDKVSHNKILSGARIIRAVRDYIGLQTGVISQIKLSADNAFTKIESSSGTLYDPVVVKALAHFRQKYDISSLYHDEVEIFSHGMAPGMRLTQDLINQNGLLLISKGHLLSAHIIEKILAIEKREGEKFKLHISHNIPEISRIPKN